MIFVWGADFFSNWIDYFILIRLKFKSGEDEIVDPIGKETVPQIKRNEDRLYSYSRRAKPLARLFLNMVVNKKRAKARKMAFKAMLIQK